MSPFFLLSFLPFVFAQALASSAPLAVPQSFADPPLQGIYITSQSAAGMLGESLAAELVKTYGANNATRVRPMIVMDIQDSEGKLSYPSSLPTSIELGNRKTRQIADLAATIKKFHDQGIYVAARMVLFKNPFLASIKPEWALKGKGTGRPFMSSVGAVWLDPSHPELKKYLIDTSLELASAGADEIQFDYARFPEGGKGGRIDYNFMHDQTMSRDESITAFVKEAAEAIHKAGAKVSVDVFGIVVWDDLSWRYIGQNIPELAKYVDALYPMPYPSHFGPGWGGHKNPADEPYFFVQETTKKFLEQTLGKPAKIRPWLQGFTLRTTRYDAKYIKDQIRALNDLGLQEFAVWNARNDYEVPFKGMR